MAFRNHRATRIAYPHADALLSRARVIAASAALLAMALAACQHAVPKKTSAASKEDPIVQVAQAPPSEPPDPSAVVEELSARSRIPASELQSLLDDCERTQLSMNICAFRDFVASDLELDAVFKARRGSATTQCRAEMDRVHAVWEAEREKACKEETEAEEGGSMRPMLISACKTEATRARIVSVQEMDPCSREK